MIKVEIIKEVEVIKQVTVDGHADYAEHGSDIVCAGASAVVFGLINAVDALDEDVQFDISANEDVTGHLTYRSLKSTDKEQLLLNAMLVALKTIEENYSDYITILVNHYLNFLLIFLLPLFLSEEKNLEFLQDSYTNYFLFFLLLETSVTLFGSNACFFCFSGLYGG